MAAMYDAAAMATPGARMATWSFYLGLLGLLTEIGAMVMQMSVFAVPSSAAVLVDSQQRFGCRRWEFKRSVSRGVINQVAEPMYTKTVASPSMLGRR